MRKRVLIVAQQIELRARIARVLSAAGYVVELAESRKRALELVTGRKIGAAIIVHSADLAGLGRELRDKPVRTMVLGQDEPDHALRGPEQALDQQKLLDWLNRSMTSPGIAGDDTALAPAILRIEDCQLDLAGFTFVDSNGREAPLTRRETALLAAFVGNPCRVLSRDQLSQAVVGHQVELYGRGIDMLVARLRHKIERDPKRPRFIICVPGVGYKFLVRPQSAENGKPLPTIDLEQRREGLEGAKPASVPGQSILSQHCEPETRQLTALSCELAGLTAPGAYEDPEDFGATVERFRDICSAVVRHWGGAVINSVGGEILALFGHPRAHEDDAERAVHAGLDLVAKVGALLSPSGAPLQVRIAMATGLVVVGDNRTAIGEAVVAAARLRNVSSPNSILVDASTRKLLGSVFECDNPELCGAEPVTAYRVTGKRAIESRFIASQRGRLTPLVGRENELQQLSTLWERTKGGKGQVALLCGEAGIGKSRVCEAWLDSIADEPHVIIRCQCSPHHTNSPFYPSIRQLEHATRLEREDGPDEKLNKLKAVLSRAGAATLADTPFFAALLSIPTDGAYVPPNLTPQRQRELTIAALVRQVLGLALARTVVVELADAHWIDSSTLELLSRCIASIKTARIFILVSFRPEFLPPWLEESHVAMLWLDRLAREQAAAIVFDVAGRKELPREIHEQIVSKCDGVPLFAEELTRTVLESGLVQDAGERYVINGPQSGLAIPTTLLGSLTARLDKLGPSKEIVQIGAAIGREFSYRLLAALAPVSGPSLRSALDHAAACKLISVLGEPPNATYIFTHALVQDAAYATMLRRKRQQLHHRIADALMAGFPETVETQPELLAHHLAQAGLSEGAIEHLQKAGRRAIEHSANAEAIGHLTRALELLRSLPESPQRKHAMLGLEVMLSQAMIASRGYTAPETIEIFLRAREIVDDATDPPKKFAVLYGIWACHHVGGDVARQKDTAAEFLAEAERHNDPATLCIAHRLLGTTYVRKGEFADGLHHLQRARALYDLKYHGCYRFEYGHDIGVTALCYLSWALWHLGHVDQASEVAAEAMKRAEELSHPHSLVFAFCLGGLLDLFRRRCEGPQLHAGLVISLCTENAFSHWINCGRIFEGWTEIRRGKIDHGLEVLRAGILGWRKGGARLYLPFLLTLEAEACLESGRVEAALQAIEEALAVSRDTGECWAMAEVLRIKARLLQAMGHAEAQEIETILVNSLEIARHQQARCWELRASCDLARLWQDHGRDGKALKLLQSVYDQFTEGFDMADLRDAKALMGSLRRKAGTAGVKDASSMPLA
jgi:class 3 adenylate cyclase/predicted ATPase/DNA-binding response OmpR family regulator